MTRLSDSHDAKIEKERARLEKEFEDKAWRLRKEADVKLKSTEQEIALKVSCFYSYAVDAFVLIEAVKRWINQKITKKTALRCLFL